MTSNSSAPLGPASLWLEEPLPSYDRHLTGRAHRFTRTILTLRGGAGKVLYASYVTGLFSLVYGVPAMTAIVSALAAPSMQQIWRDQFAQHGLAPVITMALILLHTAAQIRGAVAPSPPQVDFVASSPIPRRLTLRPTWFGNLAIVAGAFTVVSLAAVLGVSGSLHVQPRNAVVALFGALLCGVIAAGLWRNGQLEGTSVRRIRGAMWLALLLQVAILVLSILDASGSILQPASAIGNVITGPGGWAALLWHDTLTSSWSALSISGLALLSLGAGYTLLDQRVFSRLRIDNLRRQARRNSDALQSITTGDLRSARTGIVPRNARLRGLSLRPSHVLVMVVRRDALGVLRAPLLPLIGVAMLVPGALFLNSAFAHRDAAVLSSPLGLLLCYFGLSLLNEGSRMHADNGGRTSLWGVSYRHLALDHLLFPALTYLVLVEVSSLLAFSRGFGQPLAALWLILILPAMLGMQTVSNYKGSMPLSMMVGSPTAAGSGPVMMLVWLLYPLLLTIGSLWPITFFAAHGRSIQNQFVFIAAVDFVAVWLMTWQTGRHNRRRAQEGTMLERAQAKADESKAEMDAAKRSAQQPSKRR